MDPALYRPAQGSIPDRPGVYRFRDAERRVVYVGKAKSLRSRLGQYFQDPDALHPRTRSMVWAATSVTWTVVATEVEALQLEYAWIKEFDPRFNVKYRDDKSYPFLAVSVGEEFPRAQVMRGSKRKGVRYFGPYSHAWAIRETLDQLLRVFPDPLVQRRRVQAGRPNRAPMPARLHRTSARRLASARSRREEHRVLVDDLCAFLAGDTARFMKERQRQMKEAADAQEYERAARLRDDIRALERALERNTVVLADGTDADVIAMAEDELEAAFQVFHVRGGRVRGQRGIVTEKVDDVDGPALDGAVPHLPVRRAGAERSRARSSPEWPDRPSTGQCVALSAAARSDVDVRVPQRGDKRSLMETVARNACARLGSPQGEAVRRPHRSSRGA